MRKEMSNASMEKEIYVSTTSLGYASPRFFYKENFGRAYLMATKSLFSLYFQ